MKGKKGIEITTGTLIIIILAVIALIAIALFFTTGFGQVADTIKGIFTGATKGISKELAMQNCQQYCDRLQSLPVSSRSVSTYCTTYLNIDENDDGEAEVKGVENGVKTFWKYYCYPSSQKDDKRFLNVPCEVPGEVTGTVEQVKCQ